MGPEFRKRTILLKSKAAFIAACAASASASAVADGPQVKACVSGLNGGGRKLQETNATSATTGRKSGQNTRMVLLIDGK